MVTEALARRLDLADDPRSAGRARRFVQGLLEDAGRTDWGDRASLAVSEVVTNSHLHGRSRVELTVLGDADHVRVEVRGPRDEDVVVESTG